VKLHRVGLDIPRIVVNIGPTWNWQQAPMGYFWLRGPYLEKLVSRGSTGSLSVSTADLKSE